MRAILGGVMAVALVVTAGVSADDTGEKFDAKKLVGKWEPKDGKDKFRVEFTKDGKVAFAAGDKDDFKADGTYKLTGNKLMMTIKFGGEEKSMTRTISKLTDTEMTSKDDEKGKEDTLVRVKEKK